MGVLSNGGGGLVEVCMLAPEEELMVKQGVPKRSWMPSDTVMSSTLIWPNISASFEVEGIKGFWFRSRSPRCPPPSHSWVSSSDMPPTRVPGEPAFEKYVESACGYVGWRCCSLILSRSRMPSLSLRICDVSCWAWVMRSRN